MEYIEKAKYELIMAIKNEESLEIINILKQYYSDMVKIVSVTYHQNLINKDDIKKIKYILNLHNYENSEKTNSFIFSDSVKLMEFYDKNNDKSNNVTVLELYDIDPENNYRPNIEEKYDVWKSKKHN